MIEKYIQSAPIPNFVGMVQAAAPFILCAIVIALVLIAADSGRWSKRR